MKPRRETAAAAGVRHLTVDAGQAGQRLDNFLIAKLKGVPRSRIYRLLRRGEVRVNKGRSRPDYRLCGGDVVRLPPVRTAERLREDLAGTDATGRFGWLEARILHEDDDLLVLDKPAGLAVHGGSAAPIGLIEALRALRPQAAFLELAHRLDRDTSGCLLLAKSRAALGSLHEQLRSGRIEKRYLALAKGALRGRARRVEAMLERGQYRSGGRRVRVTEEEGKAAATGFTARRRYLGATLVEIALHTGRTHQARVHAAHIGHPLAGDDKYGDRDFNRELRALGLRRLFLHAASLVLAHPASGRRLRIEAPLPPELEVVLQRLQTADA
jgi:23S rRNA pseudouridine955/2504/2580 synthase